MFRFLKGFMKGEDAHTDLGIGDLPAWIDGEEKKARQDLAARVVAARAVLLDARRQMDEVLSSFDTASMGEVPHPKLAGVTERSLPLFLKAMRTSISRALPDEPEGFYTAAGEVLKGCLSAFRGQGRYLASRFPEEMKVLREGVDTMGREVNALTPGISKARERLCGLADLRESLARYQDAKRRASVGRKEMYSLEEEERAARASLEGVNHALKELEKGEEFGACQGELSRIKSLEEDRNGVTRLYRASTATSVHLFRKGEKIASRKKDRDAVRILHEAIDLLDRDLPIPEDSVSGIVPPAQKVIATQVASGDLTLKNREESDLLQTPEHLVQVITEISGRFQAISGDIVSKNETILSRPAFVRDRDLKKEMEGLEKRITLANGRLDLAKKEVAELEDQIRILFDDVRQRVEGLSGKPVQVRDPDIS
jgi:predicted  nucleic acid-binding Zn-ribbon protein